jgi:uncharacterized protein YfiM (DUF2279 family)
MRRVLLFAVSFQAFAAPDGWLGSDKAKHFFLGVFVQSAAFGAAQAAGADRSVSLGVASGASIAAVTAKELRDRKGRGTSSVKDAVWGLAGAAAISPVLARTK